MREAMRLSLLESERPSRRRGASVGLHVECDDVWGDLTEEEAFALAIELSALVLHGRFSAPPLVTTSSISYRITIVSSTRYPFSGFSRTLLRTNLRYPWQLRAFGSCFAHEIFTAP